MDEELAAERCAQSRSLSLLSSQSSQSCATTVQHGGVDVDADLLRPATQKMRAGPSDSECRLRVQTTGGCVGPMTDVVSATGKGEVRLVRYGLERRTQVNR